MSELKHPICHFSEGGYSAMIKEFTDLADKYFPDSEYELNFSLKEDIYITGDSKITCIGFCVKNFEQT